MVNIELLYEKNPTVEVLERLLAFEAAREEKAAAKEIAYVEAFTRAQKNMGVADKTARNEYYNSKYATHEDVWDACHMALNDEGISVSQKPATVYDLPGGKVEIIVNTKLTHVAGHSDSAEISVIIPIEEEKKNDGGKKGPNLTQRIGGVITYLRRYGLSSITGIPFGEDDDGNMGRQKDSPDSSRPRCISEAQYKYLAGRLGQKIVALDVAGRKKITEQVRTKFGVAEMKMLPVSRLQDAIEFIDALVIEAPPPAVPSPSSVPGAASQVEGTVPTSEVPATESVPPKAEVAAPVFNPGPMAESNESVQTSGVPLTEVASPISTPDPGGKPEVISQGEYRILANTFKNAVAKMDQERRKVVRLLVSDTFGVAEMKDLPRGRYQEALDFLNAYVDREKMAS